MSDPNHSEAQELVNAVRNGQNEGPSTSGNCAGLCGIEMKDRLELRQDTNIARMSDSRHRAAAAQPNRASASQIENEQESESGIVLLLPRRIWDFLLRYHHYSLEVMYISLCFFRVLSFIVYAGYDAKCLLYEETSIVNCSQEFLVHNPRQWIMAWMLIKILSSILLVLILCLNGEELNYCGIKSSFKKLKIKGSFWSMNVLFAFTLLYYFLAISNRNEISKGMSTLILFRLMASLLVVYCLNYLHPVQRPDTGDVRYVLALWLQRNSIPVWFNYQPREQQPSREELCRNLRAVCCFLAYRFTLLLYCAENFYIFLAVTLDAAEEVTPIREGAVQFKPLVAMLLGIRVTLYARILSFFWNKVFHGNKDLFSEPSQQLPNED